MLQWLLKYTISRIAQGNLDKGPCMLGRGIFSLQTDTRRV
jgi:hypothetical protein